MIEYCNYNDYPIGGYLSFAKQMVSAYGHKLSLVGVSEDDTPIGVWTTKKINGVEFDFFSLRKINKTNRKKLIPRRIVNYLLLRKYIDKILSINIQNIFIQTPEALFALRYNRYLNVCTRIPGVENPLSISRYWYGKYLSRIFDLFFFKYLRKTSLILATADHYAINDFIKRSKGKLEVANVRQFPSRINTDIFKPIAMKDCRLSLGINENITVVVTTGRLSTFKGWKLMLDAFMIYRNNVENAVFYFLGDGEEHKNILNYIETNNLKQSVFIAGRLTHEELARYLNAADIYVMGSYVEGWSTSLMEAIACGKPAVITNFSSSKELVMNDINGYVINDRDAREFANCMLKCKDLDELNLRLAADKMQVYSTNTLEKAINQYWNLI